MFCTGKKQFDRVTASKVARDMNDRHSGARIVSFKCTECGHWHVGQRNHKPARQPRLRFFDVDEAA